MRYLLDLYSAKKNFANRVRLRLGLNIERFFDSGEEVEADSLPNKGDIIPVWLEGENEVQDYEVIKIERGRIDFTKERRLRTPGSYCRVSAQRWV